MAFWYMTLENLIFKYKALAFNCVREYRHLTLIPSEFTI
jgi:hypothetical protein